MAESTAPDAERSVRAETILTAAIGAVSLVVITLGLLLWSAERQSRNEARVVELVRAARMELIHTSQAQNDAEAIAARYVATGERVFLADFAEAKTTAREHLAVLQSIIAADSEASAAAARIAGLVEERFTVLDSETARRAAGRTRGADDRIYSARREETAALFALLNSRIDDARAAEDMTRVQLSALTAALALLSLIGSVLGILALRRERMQWRLAHDAAEDARAKAAASDIAKTRFLAVASHDMRQPLHALTLYLTALERRVETAEAREIVSKMDRAVQSMIGMFASLLDLARLQAGVIRPEIADAPLQHIFEAAAAEHPGGKVEIAATDIAVRSDPRLLERVVSNLVTNAVKHGGSAQVSARAKGADVEVTIADQGPGIAREDQERIFNEFERLGARSDGLGLGLTIVRRLSELLAIGVRLESDTGEGTRFILSVPIANAAAPPTPPSAETDTLRGVPVLAMDDDALAREAIAGLLRDLGAEVRACANGDEAEAIVRAGYTPRLLVLDLRIEGELRGLEIAGRLRALMNPPPPTIMITGDTEPQTLEALRASGHAWLIKPVSPDDLGTAVADLLRPARV